LGQVISEQYENGKRVIWVNGSSFVAKLDYDNYNIISMLRITEAVESTGFHEAMIDLLDSDEPMEKKIPTVLKTGFVGGLSSVYIMMNSKNEFIAALPRGVRVYGDQEEGNPASGIVIRNQVAIPDDIPGKVTGMNMTYDGYLIVVMNSGYLLAYSPGFESMNSYEMKFRDDSPAAVDAGTFVRNSVAIDKDGGIYIASMNHMHKVICKEGNFSGEEKDGAWVAQYPNNGGLGSGSTPALMGFGEGNDQFVVITDGDKVMNMTLFWRNELPRKWKGIKGLPSKRIAASVPVNFGDENATEIQQEQGVTIDGYGAIVVNNSSRNVPPQIMQASKANPNVMWAFQGYMNGFDQFKPYGVEKLVWDSKKRKMTVAWINNEVSDPTCVPFVSTGSKMFYTIGSRNGEFTFEAIDTETGASAFHYIIGGARYNGFYSAPTMDEEGRILYGGLWGVVRLAPKK
jgi:hypothetical protein